MLIPQDQRDPALRALAGMNPLDVLAAIGGLQLLPENANALFRLESAAGVASAMTPADDGGVISDDAAIAWVNRPVFGAVADPFDNSFTDEFLFHYGSFVVFPGLREEAFFIVRMLARALHTRGDLPAEFFEPAQRLLAATLMISDAIARKAGLHRGVDPTLQEHNRAVASNRPLNNYKDAVSFSAAELAQWLNPLPVESLAPLVQDLPAPVNAQVPPAAPLHRPIMRSAERFVVAAPHFLLPALIHALLQLAREHGQLDSVATRFHDAVYGSGLQSALYLGWDEIQAHLPALGTLRGHESVFAFDTGKLAHVLVLTDDLASFDGDPFSAWDAQALQGAVEARLDEVSEHLLALSQQPEQVLQLVVIQGLDRPSLFALEDGGDRTPRLVLTGAEFETIALLDGGRRLLLWKYAQARQRFLYRTHAVGGSELDLFYIYREHEDSFYLGDDELPDVGLVPLEGVGALRREVQRKRDLHGAQYINGALVEVMLTQQQREVPIYMPMPPPPGARRALLVEGYAMPVWIFSPDAMPDSRYGARYAQIVEMLAYWMWRFMPSLDELVDRIAERCHQLWLEVELVPDEAWFAKPEPGANQADDLIECIATGPCRLTVRLRGGFVNLVNRHDNEGERELMRRVLKGLVSVEAFGRAGDPLLDDAAIEAAITVHAPLGPQKMIVTFDTSEDPTLDDRGVPSARFVQEHDEAEAMDELGDHLIEDLGLPIGPVAPERRTEVLNAAVSFHLGQLEELVASLSPDGLLEFLALATEALTTNFNRMRFELPTKNACYGDVGSITEQLAKQLPKSSSASVANRFLIEYVAAQPPSGTRLMSQALYDRMLALADQLHSRGFVSDLIHFGLDDPEVSVLPSRRLGVSRDTAYTAGREAYLQQFTRGEVARSVDRFPRLWRGDEPTDSVPDVSAYDVALEAELGLTFSQMRDLYGAVLSAGYARGGAVTVTRVSDLVDELEATLGWSREDVERGFDLLALRPRAQFAPPGGPFRTEDVYPWRFNRTLSYLRRPLAVRPGANGEEVVWGDRHFYVAILYFGDLVINGYLKAESSEMRSLIGRLRDEDGHEFTKQVSELFEAQERFIVRREVKKIGGVRIERRRGEDLGDVDVFVAEPGARMLRAIEAKDLAVARTPAELSNELAATFKSTTTHQAAIDRHVERVEWLRERIPDVLAWLGLEDDPDLWSVEGLMVLDIELMSPYLVDPPLPVITYRELRDELDRA